MKNKTVLILMLFLLAALQLFAAATAENKQLKFIIVYATRAGSTAEVAEAIARVIRERGGSANVFNATKAPATGCYDAAIIGSAIHMGAWLPEAIEYIDNNSRALSRIPVAYFNCGMLITSEKAGDLAQVKKYNDPVKAMVAPVADANFAGKMDYSKLNFIEAFISRIYGIQESDRRDFAAIRKWANTVYDKSVEKLKYRHCAVQPGALSK
jgi:menaquinone-dependent protoporphyrinogen oxidase